MRQALIIFSLLWALGASGQIYIDSYRFAAAPSATLLLDDYPNAAAAYSLRKLRTAYTGNCIVVRRASTGDTLAIGFSGNYLDTASLKTFCASTDCFVRRWYDQAGGGWDVVQNTNDRQPAIVTAGVIIRMNNTPTIRFTSTASTATNDWLQSVTLGTYSGVITTFAVFDFNSVAGTKYIYDQGVDRYILYSENNFLRAYVNTDLLTITPVTNTQYLSYALYNTTSSVVTINTSTFSGTTGAFNNATFITIGGAHNAATIASTPHNGDIWEFVTYRSNQSANQANIRANINSFYNVY